MPVFRFGEEGFHEPGFARASSSRVLTDFASTTDGRRGANDVSVVCVNV